MASVSEDRDEKGRFIIGWKGGPGRPKGTFTSLTSILRKALEGTELGGQKTPDDRMVSEWFIDHVIGHAMNGNASIIKEILDRIDGKVADAIKADVEMRNATRPIFETGDDGRDPEVPPPAETT